MSVWRATVALSPQVLMRGLAQRFGGGVCESHSEAQEGAVAGRSEGRSRGACVEDFVRQERAWRRNAALGWPLVVTNAHTMALPPVRCGSGTAVGGRGGVLSPVAACWGAELARYSSGGASGSGSGTADGHRAGQRYDGSLHQRHLRTLLQGAQGEAGTPSGGGAWSCLRSVWQREGGLCGLATFS